MLTVFKSQFFSSSGDWQRWSTSKCYNIQWLRNSNSW